MNHSHLTLPYSSSSSSAFIHPISLRAVESSPQIRITAGRKQRHLCSLTPNTNNTNQQQQQQQQQKQQQQKQQQQHQQQQQTYTSPQSFNLWRIFRSPHLSKTLIATVGAIVGTACNVPRQFYPSNHNHNHYPYSISMIQSARAASSPSSTTETQQEQQKKNVRYNGRKELDSSEKAMSLMLTGGSFAALGVWAWKQNRRDDELESVRIKDEVERLEKIRAEFLDVEEDDDSLDDEDLLASLKQRLSEEEDDDGDDENENDEDKNDQEDSETKNESNKEKQNDDDDSNNLETKNLSTIDKDTNSSDNTSNSDSNQNDPDSVDMLRRMWEATDEDPKKGKDTK